MAKDVRKPNIWNLSLNEFAEKTTKKRPEITGGSVILSTANMGLALIIMALKMSLKTSKDEGINKTLENQIKELRKLQTKLKKSAEKDLEVFNKLRELPGAAHKHLDEPLYHKNYINAIDSPIEGLKVVLKIMELAKDSIKHCKKAYFSDLGAGIYILSASFQGLLLIIESNINLLPQKEKTYFHKLKTEQKINGDQLMMEFKALRFSIL